MRQHDGPTIRAGHPARLGEFARLLEDPAFDAPAPLVLPGQRRRDGAALLGPRLGEQPHRLAGVPEAAAGVEARCEAEGDVLAVG